MSVAPHPHQDGKPPATLLEAVRTLDAANVDRFRQCVGTAAELKEAADELMRLLGERLIAEEMWQEADGGAWQLAQALVRALGRAIDVQCYKNTAGTALFPWGDMFDAWVALRRLYPLLRSPQHKTRADHALARLLRAIPNEMLRFDTYDRDGPRNWLGPTDSAGLQMRLRCIGVLPATHAARPAPPPRESFLAHVVRLQLEATMGALCRVDSACFLREEYDSGAAARLIAHYATPNIFQALLSRYSFFPMGAYARQTLFTTRYSLSRAEEDTTLLHFICSSRPDAELLLETCEAKARERRFYFDMHLPDAAGLTPLQILQRRGGAAPMISGHRLAKAIQHVKNMTAVQREVVANSFLRSEDDDNHYEFLEHRDLSLPASFLRSSAGAAFRMNPA